MTRLLDDVKPGDLITSEVFNKLLVGLSDLDDRVTALEGAVPSGGPVVITQVVPAGPVRMGDELRLIGRSFGIPGLNSVNINNTPVTNFKSGSNDTLLIFDIPAVQGIPPAGQTVSVNLSNSNGFASATIFLLPGQPSLPTGQIFVAMAQPPTVPTVLSPQDLFFGFAITGVTSMDEVYSVTPRVDLGWRAVLVAADDSEISPQEIAIPQGNPPQGVNTTFRVKVSVPAGTPSTTVGQFNVTVAAKRNPTQLRSVSPTLAITVGSPPPGAQNDIIIARGTVFQPGVLVGDVVQVPTNQQVRVDFSAMIKTAGSYVITTPVQFSSPAGWNAIVVGGGTLLPTSPNSNNLVSIVLTASAGASPTTMTVRIASAANPAMVGELRQSLSAV